MSLTLSTSQIQTIFQEVIPAKSEEGRWFLCKYGEQFAILVEGPNHYIEKTHILFCNFGFNALLHTLKANQSFIPVTMRNLRKTMLLFFSVMLRKIESKYKITEQEVTYYIDEDGEHKDKEVMDISLLNEADIETNAELLTEMFISGLQTRAIPFVKY